MLNDQLSQANAKQNHDHAVMQETMTQELEEVRHAVREYQLELTTEKSNFMSQIANLEAQLNATYVENTNMVEDSSRRDDQAKLKIEGAETEVKHTQDRLKKQEDLTSEVRDELQKQVTLVEGNAKNQIQYLQTRIQEIVEETQASHRYDQPSSQGSGQKPGT